MKPENIITHLNMQPHPEGGFYSETFRSRASVVIENGDTRSAGTAIYYMLVGEDKSHFHQIGSDEIWLFHLGDSLEIICITEDGRLETHLLGNQLNKSESLQVVLNAKTWFGARLKDRKGYALVSCIVTPGFEFSDFELAERNKLISLYPHHHSIISEMTR